MPAWSIPSADFPADPAITFGVLPNGMRYAIKRSTNPTGEAAIRFTIAADAREENDAEKRYLTAQPVEIRVVPEKK